MRLINSEQLNSLQKVTTNLRNICIVAHVDHGKTTLADSLIASNGIISPRMAGKLRYMDSRPDEQERGITMKSSSISLYYAKGEGEEYLINLIDSPGHVDFSTEVSTAVRLCDGAIVVVDVVEGVSPQTRVALKQAYSEDIKPVLILNKIDRLIVEMKLTPLDAYIHLTQVLEQVNAVMGELFASEVLEKEDMDNVKQQNVDNDHKDNPDAVYNWTSALEEADDSTLYFSPQDGNVVFASAIDGWGFTIETFAKMFSEKLGVKAELLQKVLWGDYYLNSKSKRFLRGAQEKAKKPLFVQVVLDNLWALYENVVIRNDREKTSFIADKLGIKLTARDLRHTDTKIQLQSLMTQWLPLSTSVLDMIVKKLPSPKEISAQKVEKLMCSHVRDFDTHLPDTQKLKDDFLACEASADRPIIVFISKMFPVDRRSLPENKPRVLTQEEMAKRREIARQIHADKQLQLSQPENGKVDSQIVEDEKPVDVDVDEDVFIAFARIFSGKLRRGSKVYVLGPKHDPSQLVNIEHVIVDPSLTLKDLQSNQHITCTEINHIYLLMGRELEHLEEAVAGNIIGIGGLEEHVLKTATLSSVLCCPSFSEMRYAAVPIVRVAVETLHPADLPKLVKGLKLLNQADPSVQVLLQETGEHVLITAGEVHLERCLEDLRTRYAKVAISVSEPIVPFRETIVEPPKVDMVNEEIETPITTDKKEEDKTITMHTPSKQCVIRIRAIPLPADVTTLLEENCELLKVIHTHVKVLQSQAQRGIEDLKDITLSDRVYYSGSSTEVNTVLSERLIKSIESFKSDLRRAFDKAGPEWSNVVDKIWSAGPRNCGPNLLLNLTDMQTKYFDCDRVLPEDKRRQYESSFINGFQLATLAGPLCEEPMMGVAFCVEEWTLQNENEDGNSTSTSQPYGPLSGQIMSAMKEGCRKAFQAQPQRLVAAMYSCDVLVNQQVLGKLYAVLGRRHGRILGGDLAQGSAYFRVSATLPVAESFRFAAELRTHTSGLASPQLLFSHWEVIDIDPFWTPSTEEEYLHFGEKADSVNRALAYRDAVRRRKGLHVADKLVESAEKQRTLSKNK